MPLFLLPFLGALKSVFAWLVKNPMVLIIVVLVAIAAVQTMRLGNAKRDLASERAALKTCTANTKALSAALDTQNAAIRAQAAADVKATADATKALARVRGGAAGVAKQVAAIEAATPGTDACAAARALILASLK